MKYVYIEYYTDKPNIVYKIDNYNLLVLLLMFKTGERIAYADSNYAFEWTSYYKFRKKHKAGCVFKNAKDIEEIKQSYKRVWELRYKLKRMKTEMEKII